MNSISSSSVLRNHIKLKLLEDNILLLFNKGFFFFFAAFLNLHLKDFLIPLPVILFLIGCCFEILSFTSDKVCIVNMSILCCSQESYKYKDGLRRFVKTRVSSLSCHVVDAQDVGNIRYAGKRSGCKRVKLRQESVDKKATPGEAESCWRRTRAAGEF